MLKSEIKPNWFTEQNWRIEMDHDWKSEKISFLGYKFRIVVVL